MAGCGQAERSGRVAGKVGPVLVGGPKKGGGDSKAGPAVGKAGPTSTARTTASTLAALWRR